LLDSGGQLKIAGFGTVRFSLISPDEAQLVQPEPNIDLSSKFLGISKNKILDFVSFQVDLKVFIFQCPIFLR